MYSLQILDYVVDWLQFCYNIMIKKEDLFECCAYLSNDVICLWSFKSLTKFWFKWSVIDVA